jgi:hypothetical protein
MSAQAPLWRRIKGCRFLCNRSRTRPNRIGIPFPTTVQPNDRLGELNHDTNQRDLHHPKTDMGTPMEDLEARLHTLAKRRCDQEDLIRTAMGRYRQQDQGTTQQRRSSTQVPQPLESLLRRRSKASSSS